MIFSRVLIAIIDAVEVMVLQLLDRTRTIVNEDYFDVGGCFYRQSIGSRLFGSNTKNFWHGTLVSKLNLAVLLVYGYLAEVKQEFTEVFSVFLILKNDLADGNFCVSW